MNLPRYWRLRNIIYGLEGEIHWVCGEKHFPPRDVCPKHETPLDRELKNLRSWKADNPEMFQLNPRRKEG